MAEVQIEQFPDSYNLADVEEVFSVAFEEEICKETKDRVVLAVLDNILDNPIFERSVAASKKQ